MDDRDTFLNTDQAVEFFGCHISKRTFEEWRGPYYPGGPPWLKLGKHVVYRLSDLRAFADARLVEPQPIRRKRRTRRVEQCAVESAGAALSAKESGS